jgi:hypothetical protein
VSNTIKKRAKRAARRRKEQRKSQARPSERRDVTYVFMKFFSEKEHAEDQRRPWTRQGLTPELGTVTAPTPTG